MGGRCGESQVLLGCERNGPGLDALHLDRLELRHCHTATSWEAARGLGKLILEPLLLLSSTKVTDDAGGQGGSRELVREACRLLDVSAFGLRCLFAF